MTEPKKGSALGGMLILTAMLILVMVAFIANWAIGLIVLAGMLLIVGLSLGEALMPRNSWGVAYIVRYRDAKAVEENWRYAPFEKIADAERFMSKYGQQHAWEVFKVLQVNMKQEWLKLTEE